MLVVFVITLLLAERHSESYGSGFDAYSSCYRTSRQKQHLPCDFTKQNWCSSPGSSYPWHAVRRFVHENQGLMKRMYGDERHISVLKAELENNEIEYFYDAKDKDEARSRYSKTITSSLLFGKKTSKSVKTKKAISNIGSSNSLGKNNFLENKKLHADLSKSTPLLTIKPQTTHATTTTPAPSTTEPPTSTQQQLTSVTSTPPTTTPASLTPTSQLEVAEQSHAYLETTLQPNETQTITETDEPMPTTEVVSEAEATTEQESEVGDETTYAEQENYEDSVEEEDEDDEDLGEDSPPQKSPPILRLKGINACPVKEEVVAPFWANNTRGEVLALLNLYPFEQYVHWEKCSYEHKQMFCREGCRCEQQYRLHRLLAYDPNNECRGIFSDWFRFPSCCVCKCYDVPMELRLTSRSPRTHTKEPSTVPDPT